MKKMKNYYIGAQFGYGIFALFQLETSGFAALLKVGHLAICLPSASQIIRFPHILACYIVIIDPGVFWCGKPLCQAFLNMHTIFLKFQSRKNLLRCPKSETRFLPPASRFEAPGHRCSWRPLRPLLRAKAPQPRRSVWPQAASRAATAKMPTAVGTAKVVGMLSSNRSTNKRTMNVSGLNIFKSVQSKKHSHLQ